MTFVWGNVRRESVVKGSVERKPHDLYVLVDYVSAVEVIHGTCRFQQLPRGVNVTGCGYEE